MHAYGDAGLSVIVLINWLVGIIIVIDYFPWCMHACSILRHRYHYLVITVHCIGSDIYGAVLNITTIGNYVHKKG